MLYSEQNKSLASGSHEITQFSVFEPAQDNRSITGVLQRWDKCGFLLYWKPTLLLSCKTCRSFSKFWQLANKFWNLLISFLNTTSEFDTSITYFFWTSLILFHYFLPGFSVSQFLRRHSPLIPQCTFYLFHAIFPICIHLCKRLNIFTSFSALLMVRFCLSANLPVFHISGTQLWPYSLTIQAVTWD